MLRNKRPIIFPNFGFQKQLMQYEQILKDKFSQKNLQYTEKGEEIKIIDEKEKTNNSKSPFVRHNKLNMHNRVDGMKGYSPPYSHQLKPKQFYYP